MSATRNLKDLNLTPTVAYFFAKQTNLLSEEDLQKCKSAAQEYVRSTNFKSKKSLNFCDEYFIDITTAHGCIVFDDELPEVNKSVHSAMKSGLMTEYYKVSAISYIKEFLAIPLSEKDKDSWCDKIQKCNLPYLRMREDKFKNFAEGVLKYILEGILPGKKDENNLLKTVEKLDDNEKRQLKTMINTKMSTILLKPTSFYAPKYLLNKATSIFSGPNPIEERAKKFEFLDNLLLRKQEEVRFAPQKPVKY